MALLSDFPGQLRRRKRLYLGDAFQPVDVESIRINGEQLIVRLADVTTAADASALFGELLYVRREEAAKPPHGSHFEHEVLGLRVETTDGQDIGTVAEILRTGANDVYLLRGELGEILIPVIADVVKSISPTDGRIVVEPIPGLLP